METSPPSRSLKSYFNGRSIQLYVIHVCALLFQSQQLSLQPPPTSPSTAPTSTSPHPSFNLLQSPAPPPLVLQLAYVTDWEEQRSWSKMRQGNVFLIHWVRIRPWHIFCGCLSCVSLTPLSTNGHTSLQLLSGGSQPYFSNFSST